LKIFLPKGSCLRDNLIISFLKKLFLRATWLGLSFCLFLPLESHFFGGHLKLKKFWKGYFFRSFHPCKKKFEIYTLWSKKKNLTTISFIFPTKGDKLWFFIFLYPSLVYQFWKGGLRWLRFRMIFSFLMLIFLIFIAFEVWSSYKCSFLDPRKTFFYRQNFVSEIKNQKFYNEMIVKVSKQRKWGKNSKNHHIFLFGIQTFFG